MLLVVCPVVSACATRTVAFTTDPPGAEVLVDGKAVGHAPVWAPVRGRWIFQGARARHMVRARADGLESGVYYLEPTEVFWPGAVGCVLLLGLGCPWAAQIPDEVNIRLAPVPD